MKNIDFLILYFYEFLKLSVRNFVLIWVAVAAMGFFNIFAGQPVGISLIVSLVELPVLLFMDAGFNLIEIRHEVSKNG